MVLAKERYALRGRELEGQARFVPFTAQTRMSGCDLGDRVIRKGAVDAVAGHVAALGGAMPAELAAAAGRIGDTGRHAARRLRRRARARASSTSRTW